MSTWHVNALWPNFLAPDLGPVHLVDVTEDAVTLSIDPRDVLSDPAVETLLPGGLALWPRGAAWGTPDGEAPSLGSTIAGLTRALLAPFADLYRRAWRLTEEARSASMVDSLEDWEADHDLPDACATNAQTFDQRKAAVQARVLSLATITPADFVRLAARIGYVVAIEEPDGFLAGVSECGTGADEPSNAALEQQWVVHAYAAPSEQFEAGVGETGVTRLLDFDHGVLECALRRIAPAWTYLVFSYETLAQGLHLGTEADPDLAMILVNERGVALVVPREG